MELYAVIPSGNRLAELTNLVQVLSADGVNVVIVNTGYTNDDIAELGTPDNRPYVYDATEDDVNISAWWNHGIRWAKEHNDNRGGGEYVVSVLNDDIVIESGFVHALADGIMYHDVAGAFPDVFGMNRDQVFHQLSHWKMSGYAFAMRGSLGFLADERLVWWGSDQLLEWEMLRNGGLVTVGGLKLRHLYPNGSTVGPLAEQAGRDRETFKEITGVYGW